jgi:hypothetical protein
VSLTPQPSSCQHSAQPVDDVLYGKGREQHAEQARQQQIARRSERAVDLRCEQEHDDANPDHHRDDADENREIGRSRRRLAREKNGRSDGARARQQGRS